MALKDDIRGMEGILEKIFESVPRARLLRLLIQNPESSFQFKEIAQRTRLNPSACRRELKKLIKMGLARERKLLVKERHKTTTKKNKKSKEIIKTKKVDVFEINRGFILFPQLKDLVSRASVASEKLLLRELKKLGRVKLAVLAGVFLNHENARTDLLIIGDDIAKRKLDKFLVYIESELGRSIQYTLMDMDEFKYRMGMYDRFLRDILEYPHNTIIDRIGI